jgi:hypothetical protein
MRLLGKRERSLRCHGHRVHRFRAHARHLQAGINGVDRQLPVAAPLRAPANQLGFFHRGENFAVFQDGAGGVSEDAAYSENDHVSRFDLGRACPAP